MQNRPAAALAALQWHRFEQLILDSSPQTGVASVGSICFDGNVIEATLHWLEPTADEEEEHEFDVHSFQIANGIAFAATLEEFQHTMRVFRNFFDWLKELRTKRFAAIQALPRKDPKTPRYPLYSSTLNDRTPIFGAPGQSGPGNSAAADGTSNTQPMATVNLADNDLTLGLATGEELEPDARAVTVSTGARPGAPSASVSSGSNQKRLGESEDADGRAREQRG